MPPEDIYQSRIMPQAAAPMPLASPNAFGAGIGGALAQAGEAAHGAQLREHSVERRVQADRQAADFAHRYALHRENMDGIVREMRGNPTSPDYAEHVERVREAEAAAREGLLSGIGEDAVRRQAEQQLDEYGTRLRTNEADFAEGQRVAKLVVDFRKTKDIGANRIRQGMDPQTYGEELSAGYAMVDSLSNVTPEVRAKLRQELEQDYGVSFINNLNDTNPRAALAVLDAGAFNEILTPAQIEGLRNGAQVEIRRAEAATVHAANVQKAQLTEAIATVKEDASQGIDVGARLPKLIAGAEAVGDTSNVSALRGLARESAFAKVYEGQPPGQREARIAELAGQAKRTDDEQAELKWLRDKSGALDSRFNADPVRFAIEHGASKPPPIEDGLVARREWARGVSAAYGRPMPVFTAIEAAELRARSAQSPAGQIEVAGELAVLGGRDAINAARQVDADDNVLQQLVLLTDKGRRSFQAGIEVRKGNRALVDGSAGTEAQARFNDEVGTAMALFPPSQRNAAFEVSRNIYAAWASRAGMPDYKDGNFAPFVETGLGRKLGEWAGAKVLLPEGYDEDRFARTLRAYTPGAGPNAPVYADRTPMTGDDLRRYVPKARPDGLFEFHGPGGRQVMAKNGQVYVLGFPEARR